MRVGVGNAEDLCDVWGWLLDGSPDWFQFYVLGVEVGVADSGTEESVWSALEKAGRSLVETSGRFLVDLSGLILAETAGCLWVVGISMKSAALLKRKPRLTSASCLVTVDDLALSLSLTAIYCLEFARKVISFRMKTTTLRISQ